MIITFLILLGATKLAYPISSLFLMKPIWSKLCTYFC